MKIHIDRQQQFQTFERFGASGAWWAQIVGGWTHTDPQSGLAVRDKISELLYSKGKGIGLGIYRYNIGAGSKSSGKGTYSEPARRTESFYDDSGEYDWSRDANAVYMMNRAVKDGADEVILFVNSPPECMTKNGKAHCDASRSFLGNISPKNFKKFADYCLDVTEHFVGCGLPVRYLSPINEPVWKWTGGQEGCHYNPRSAEKVFRVFAEELEKRKNLTEVKLSGSENGDIRWFNKTYTRILLRDPVIRRNIDAVDFHSYFLKVPLPFLNDRIAFMRRFRRWMNKHYPDVPLKMSEWTHMQGGRDKGMDSALVAAKTIYEDISILNVISWQHWIAVSEVDYCDGLIYINLEDKTFETTKRLYVTGNFSKYIEPGSKRVFASCEDSEILPLAFVKGEKTVLILINESSESKPVSFDSCSQKALLAVTDEQNDLEESEISSDRIVLSPRSVNTVIFQGTV